MRVNSPVSLWSAISAQDELPPRFLFGAEASCAMGDLVRGSALNGDDDQLLGKSWLIATTSQIAAALALIELDGIARRIVLFPPDAPLDQLPYVIASAEVDSIVSDGRETDCQNSGIRQLVGLTGELLPRKSRRQVQYETEWVLLTSGTTGLPKLVVHTLRSLAGAVEFSSTSAPKKVWSTFYDIRRYGGLQIFLRAVLTGTSLVLSSAAESTAEFLKRAGSCGVTHISGTPSHWRRVAMSPASNLITPEYVRLSGEIADQAILNNLHAIYPQARIAHAFATTEAGVAFDVKDGMAGFPISLLDDTPGVDMKIDNRSLRIRSDRTASRYLCGDAAFPRDAEGFVDTGDLIEVRGDRCIFVGRRDGVINVGGDKVYPEEVEAVINRHPAVHMSLVQKRKNPITGALVAAQVVLKTEMQTPGSDVRSVRGDILLLCREALSPHKVPATIDFVSALPVSESGKLVRSNA